MKDDEKKLKQKEKDANVTRRLSSSEIADLLANLIWCPDLYRTYCTSIKGDYFRDDLDETCLAYAWGALQNYYNAEGTETPPTRAKFEMYLRNYIRNSMATPEQESLLFDDTDEAISLMTVLFEPSRAEMTFETGEPLAKQFLVERAIANEILMKVKFLQDMKEYIDLDEVENLRKLSEKASRIEALSAEIPIDELAPDLTYFNNAKRQKIVPCGISWIDERIGKGQRYGDVNGLIGPTGSGKTTLGAQLFASNIKQAAMAKGIDGDNRVCVFFTYEQNAFDVQIKVYSNTCHISRGTLETDDFFLNAFSQGTPERPLKDYEIGRFADAEKSEYDRYNKWRDILSAHGVIRNMSGVADVCDDARARAIKQHKGKGGIQEIVNELYNIQNKRNQKIRAVFIDYVGLVMERQYSDSMDPKQMYYALKRFGDDVRQQIAAQFDCVVWLLHQMSGAANKTRATTPLTHADSEGCRSLANNMANCLCLGTKDAGLPPKKGSCLYLTFSKTRHSGGCGFNESNLILRQNTLFHQLDNVTPFYKPDKGRGGFYLIDKDKDYFE